MGGKTSKPACTNAPPPPKKNIVTLNKNKTNKIKTAIINYNLKHTNELNADKEIQRLAPNNRGGNPDYTKEKYNQARQNKKQASTALKNAANALYAEIISSTKNPKNSAYYSSYLNTQFTQGSTLELTKKFLKMRGYKLNNNMV